MGILKFLRTGLGKNSAQSLDAASKKITPKMKNIVVTNLVLLALVLSATAYSQVTFMGGPDCGQWIKEPLGSRKLWLLGYMSGLNSALSDSKNDALKKINSPEQVFSWVDNYCKENPLKYVSDAGNSLFFELRMKK